MVPVCNSAEPIMGGGELCRRGVLGFSAMMSMMASVVQHVV